MTERDFIEQLRREFRRSKKEPESAAAALVKLARRASSNRSTAGVYCAQQSLGLAGMLYEQVGQPARAAQLFERVARLAKAEVDYHSKAAASALAQASRLSFLAGKSSTGVRHAESALQYLGRHPEPGSVYEEMMEAYREYKVQEDARRRKTRRK
jgi:hypothetical protein